MIVGGKEETIVGGKGEMIGASNVLSAVGELQSEKMEKKTDVEFPLIVTQHTACPISSSYQQANFQYQVIFFVR